MYDSRIPTSQAILLAAVVRNRPFVVERRISPSFFVYCRAPTGRTSSVFADCLSLLARDQRPILAALGGVLGLGLSMAGVRLLAATLSSTGFPYWMTLTMEFLTMICLGTAVAFGLEPALHSSKTDFNEVLKDGGRGSTGGRRTKRWTATFPSIPWHFDSPGHRPINGHYAVTRATSTSSNADTMFTLALDGANHYRIFEEANTLYFEKKISNAKTTVGSLPYDASSHAFWRIRRDDSHDTIIFETAAAIGNVPGIWSTRATVSRELAVTGLYVELKAGTFQSETSLGEAHFDNFRIAQP